MIWEVGLIDLRGVFVDFGETNTKWSFVIPVCKALTSQSVLGTSFFHLLGQKSFPCFLISFLIAFASSVLTSVSITALYVIIGLDYSKFKTSYSGEAGEVFHYWGGHSYLLLGIAISHDRSSPGLPHSI